MNIGEGLRESWDTISHNKLRTFLTMLGMNIGVAAVIAIMATGLMARSAIMSGVESIGAALIWITPNNAVYEEEDLPAVYLKPQDLAAMRSMLDGVVFSPSLRASLPVSYRSYDDLGTVYGVHPEYLTIWRYPLESGRFLDRDDMELRRKVVVLGSEVSRAYFASDDPPLGKGIRIGEQVFTVVGVMQSRSRSFIGDGSGDSTLYVPYDILETMMDWSRFGGPRVTNVTMQVNDIADLDRTAALLDRYLLGRHGTVAGKPRFVVHKAEENIDTFNQIFGIITTVISLVAGISLVVSGIGIMNIMLVTVTERTREIGIRKAIGAKRIDILLQFLIEAVIICLIGGGIGIVLGLVIAAAVAALQDWRYVMPVVALGVGLGVSAAIGLFFGIYPAMKASRLDPVVALTKE